MSDMVCRKSMMRCQTPGMCSPHGGCRDEVTTAKDRQISALIAENERLQGCEDVLRQLASHVGAGGYNAPEVDPETFARKIMDGINILNDPMAQLVINKGEQIDQLRAEVAGLRTGYEAYEQVNAELKAENERLERNRDMWKGQVERQIEMLRLAHEADKLLKAECEWLPKHAPSSEIIWCECGDGYPANSYGAGFMDANDGVCENCDAANLCASQSTSARISDALGRHKGEIAAERAAVRCEGLVEAQKACDRIAGDSAGRTDRERKGAGECSAAIRSLIAAMSKESSQ